MQMRAAAIGIVTTSALLLLGYFLLSQAQPSTLPTFVDRGFLSVQRGSAQAEEAYTILRTPAGWEFSLNTRLIARDKGFESRTQGVLELSPDLQPVRYRTSRVAQALAEEDREVWEINLLWGEVADGQFRLGEEDLVLAEPGAPAKTFSGTDAIPVRAPWAVLEMDTFSPLGLVPLVLLYASPSLEEQTVLAVMPLPRRSFERTLRRADPVQIVDSATGEAQQAERVLWVRPQEAPPLEILFRFQSDPLRYTFLGVAVSGEDRAFVYRKDLFPQGFVVER